MFLQHHMHMNQITHEHTEIFWSLPLDVSFTDDVYGRQYNSLIVHLWNFTVTQESHCALSVNVYLKSDRCWSITGGLFSRSSLRLILNIHHHHCISDVSFDPSRCWVNVFMGLHILSVAKHEYLLGGLGRLLDA